MSNDLANKLMNAESPDAFLREADGASGWQMMSALKSEVDRLVRSDLSAAARLAASIEELATQAGDPVSKAFAEASRACVLHHSGRYVEANALYASAVRAMRAARLATQAARIQKQQAAALKYLGRYDEALRAASAARRSLAKAGPVELAQLETNIGNIYYQLDRYKKALNHYDRARELLATAGDDTMRAFVDLNRSNIFIEMDRPDAALALLEAAAAAFDRAERALPAAQSRFHIAYLQFLRGNYSAALNSYYQVRDRLTDLQSPHLVAWCNHDIAEVLLALNSFDDAAESASLARLGFKELGLPYESAKAAMVRALAAVGLQQFDEAHADLMEARENFARSHNTTFTALVDSYLADLSIRRGDAAEAERRAASALRVFARQKLPAKSAYSRLLAARAAFSAGEMTKAARKAKASLRSIEGLFAPALEFQCHHLIGQIERDRKRDDAARASFLRAVRSVEQMRAGVAADEFKATFLQDKIEIYEDAIAACLDSESESLMEEAFRLVESSKSRALADLIARYLRDSAAHASQDSRLSINEKARARLSKLIEDLNWYNSHARLEEDKGSQRSAEVADRYRRAVLRCERQIAQLFKRLENEDGDFAGARQIQAATAADLRSVLEEDETAIEYFTTGDQVSAFIASRERFIIRRNIASKREVERQLAALRFQLEKFNYGSGYVDAHLGHLKRAIDERLSRLYKIVFAPLESAIDGSCLIIIPHGSLHYAPFHALRDASDYLVERFEISYAPSAAVLKLCRERRGIKSSNQTPPEGAQMVALGVVERGTPGIDDEIDALAAIFPGAVKLTGEQATRENLLRLAPGARFLHLASHGYFRRDNPMFSFLKLADSQLNFYSLLDLKLDAEMVTLSACHTGVNKVFPGDELHGLMRGFLYAGTPSLVVSLWAVSDRSTADFMGEMYSKIRAGARKREALRSAQLAIKDAYGHPYYWAPFVLMGSPN